MNGDWTEKCLQIMNKIRDYDLVVLITIHLTHFTCNFCIYLFRYSYCSDSETIIRYRRRVCFSAFYQISVHLATRFQRIFFYRNRPTRKKNCLWWPGLLTDRKEMSNIYNGPSIDNA